MARRLRKTIGAIPAVGLAFGAMHASPARLATQDALSPTILADTVWAHGLDAGLGYCARASRADTCPAESRAGLARILLDLGMRDAAAELWGRIIASEGGSASRYESLASARLQQGRTEAAAKLYEMALAIRETPDSAAARRDSIRLALLRREDVLGRVSGAYRTTAGEILVVKSDDYLDTYPQLLRLSDGRFEVLYPADEPNSFVHHGPDRAIGGHIRFDEPEGGRPPRLAWTPVGEPEIDAVSISRGVPFRFENGTQTLSGTAWVPRGDGPHSVAVLLPGAGPGTRSSISLEAVSLSGDGIVGVAYDKRGTGRSSGSRGWFDTSIEDQVSDAVAAYRALQRMPYARPDAIGFFGFSQGGWVVPEAANRVGHAAFVVLASGAAVGMAEQMTGAAAERTRSAGLSESDQRAVRSYMEDFFETIYEGGNLYDLNALADAAVGSSLEYGYVASLGMEVDWFRTNRVDPEAALRSIPCPALALFGADDDAVLHQVNVPLLASYLAAAPTEDFAITVIPGVDHGFRTTTSGDLDGYSPLYFSTMTRFIAERTSANRPSR